MMMEDKEEDFLPPQGGRMPSGRRTGDTVPVPGASSSDDEPSTGLRASLVEEAAIAPGRESFSPTVSLVETRSAWLLYFLKFLFINFLLIN